MSDNDVDKGAAPVTSSTADTGSAESAAVGTEAQAARSTDKSSADVKDTAVESDSTGGSAVDRAGADADGAAAGGESSHVASPVIASADAKTSAAKSSWRDRLRIPGGTKGVVAARAAVAVLLGGTIASTGYFFVQNKDNEALLAAHDEARAAACAYAPVLANYDAKNLDAYFSAVLDGATGDWKKQFDDTSRELKEVLSQGEVVSKTNDVQCAVKSGDETSAEAIVVIGQTITSVGTQGKPAPGQLSMVMRMAKVDGKWLVNKVNSPLVPAPQQ
ncbi:Mce-associated membrane protein [Nocardia amikacinitolerans]|nr:Mce-associated membrane protein [Nocardia amikacinitolerans]